MGIKSSGMRGSTTPIRTTPPRLTIAPPACLVFPPLLLVVPAVALVPSPVLHHTTARHSPHRPAMIAIQKPLNPLATMPSYHSRPTHGRHPSAPVVVRPTQTPGLLSLSKPFNPQAPRQQQQAHPRAPRSPKGKSQRPQQQKPLVQGADEAKQPASKRPEADKVSTAAPAPQEKAPRGRQPKQASHDQTAGRRYGVRYIFLFASSSFSSNLSAIYRAQEHVSFYPSASATPRPPTFSPTR